MSVRFLGLVDGRLSHALRAIHKLAALGFTEADIPELVQAYQARLDESRAGGIGRSASARLDKQHRRQVAEWSIRTMMAMGFSETEIGALAGVSPATVAPVESLRRSGRRSGKSAQAERARAHDRR